LEFAGRAEKLIFSARPAGSVQPFAMRRSDSTRATPRAPIISRPLGLIGLGTTGIGGTVLVGPAVFVGVRVFVGVGVADADGVGVFVGVGVLQVTRTVLVAVALTGSPPKPPLPIRIGSASDPVA
jgi:hypothetical protein